MPDFGTWTGVELIARFVLGCSIDFSTARAIATLTVQTYEKAFICKNPHRVDSLILCKPTYSFTTSLRGVELHRANPTWNPAPALLRTTCVACHKTQLSGINYSFKYKITSSDLCPRPRSSLTCPEAPQVLSPDILWYRQEGRPQSAKDTPGPRVFASKSCWAITACESQTPKSLSWLDRYQVSSRRGILEYPRGTQSTGGLVLPKLDGAGLSP